ncbi:hypothetical protein [Streptomyces sp. NPDC007856]|uniref:hypothetical protein n=1 Tax=Streptomyces sp. NPDC007856 TaxID=3364781 RepID=UPI00369B0925
MHNAVWRATSRASAKSFSSYGLGDRLRYRLNSPSTVPRRARGTARRVCAPESWMGRDPYLLAPLKLHYLRWVLFDDDTPFMYQGIFDTDFDKYTEDAIALFSKAGVSTAFEHLEGVSEDWRTNPEAFVRFVKIRPRTPLPELHRVRRVSVRDGGRDQDGVADQGRSLGDARPDAVRAGR